MFLPFGDLNSATINMHVPVFVWTYFFISFGYRPRGRIVDHMVTLCLII